MAATAQASPRLRALIIYAFTQEGCGFCTTAKKHLALFEKKHPEVLVHYLDVTRGDRHVQGFTVKATPTILFSVAGKIQDKLTALEPLRLAELEHRMMQAIEKSP